MLTDFLENKFLDVLFSRASWSGKPTSLYFAIFTTSPVDAGTGGVEVSGNGYARKAVAADGTQWTVDDGQATNVNVISWSPATAAWGEAKSLGIYTAATGGTLLAILELPAPIQIDQYNQFQVTAGGLVLQSAGVLTDYAREALLAYWLNGTAMPSIPTYWAGLGTGTEATRLTGEPITTWGYERKSIANSSGNWPAAASGNKKINAASPHSFLSTTGANAWPTVSHVGLFDSFGGQKVLTVPVSSNGFVTLTSNANQFQNSDRVVFVRNDLGSAPMDNNPTTGPYWHPNKVHFVSGRTATGFYPGHKSGSTFAINNNSVFTPTAATTAPTAILADAASIQVAVTSGDSAIAATAHGLVNGDRVVLCPRDFTNYGVTPISYAGTTVYPTGICFELALTGVTTTLGSANVTVASTSGLYPGANIVGAAFPAGATVASITSATVFALVTGTGVTAGTGGTATAYSINPNAPQLLYFVVNSAANTFSLAASEGGTALVPSSTGTNVDICRLNMGRMIISGQMTNPLSIAVGDSAQISDEALSIYMD